MGADTVADTGVAADAPVAEAGVEDGEFEPDTEAAADGQAPSGENGEPRRKRRRRRGRRGGRERGERPEPEGIEHHQTGFVAEADRFGAVPDEIDTTPTDAPVAPVRPPRRSGR